MKFIDKLIKAGFSWVITDIWWRLDWNKPSKSSIKGYLQDNVYLAHVFNAAQELPTITGSRDEKVTKIFNWILKNIKYQTDILNFGVKERWEDIDVVLDRERADCESQSLLLFSIARVHRISPLNIRLVCGKVHGSGHAWIEYHRDKDNVWVILDCAMRRKTLYQDSRYKERWFSVTDFDIK